MPCCTCSDPITVEHNLVYVHSAAGASNIGNTLPDGRLKVGMDLPLLYRRFRYLRLIGEGISAQVSSLLLSSHQSIPTGATILMADALQVILAEDTYSQNSRVVVIKILKRQFSSAGQKVTASTVLM